MLLEYSVYNRGTIPNPPILSPSKYCTNSSFSINTRTFIIIRKLFYQGIILKTLCRL